MAQPDLNLIGTKWILDSIGSGGADGAVSSVPAGVVSTMLISAGNELALEAGCNTGGASVEVAESSLTVGPMRLTRMMCDDAANQVEQSVLAVLDGEVDYAIDADLLTLTKGDNTLTYRASE